MSSDEERKLDSALSAAYRAWQQNPGLGPDR
jgi:hypothetical protein